MKVVNRCLGSLLLLLVSSAYSVQLLAAQNLWKDVSQVATNSQIDRLLKSKASSAQNSTGNNNPFSKARMLQLDNSQMQVLLKTSLSGDVEQQFISKITLPLPDGRIITVQPRYSEVLPKSLAKKYPEIRTFKLVPDENIISGRVDMTPAGFHAMLQMHDGEVIFIDPIDEKIKTTKQKAYASYRKKDQQVHQKTSLNSHQCLLDDSSSRSFTESFFRDASPVNPQQIKNKTASRSVRHLLRYRIAIAATGEYTTLKGGKTAALGAIVSTLNRVNQVYEQDLGIHLSLIEDNDLIIFSNANSDPYNSRDTHELIRINQEVINNIIGKDNYDLGHLFASSGGGLAIIGGVCNDNAKAMGISGTANPGSDSFTLDFVAHEIGHQIGATHSFNSSEGLCSGGTRTDSTAFEPGSGSTIMSYAGICGSDNLQSHADAMFHIGSIEQIRNFTQSGNGSRCGIRAVVSNEPPQPDAGSNYVIPANTPFVLKGNATDPEGDRLVYAWEQVDVGSSSLEFEDTGNNALFRAHIPNRSKSRTFPPIGNIISHRIPRGENLPVRERQLRFKLVAQDGYNSAQSDEMSISVKRTGSRFALDLPRTHYSLGRDYKISWNTANTEKAPVYCDNVDILLSTNSGYDFDYMLAEDVPNTGETWVYLSSGLPESFKGRFKLACSNNIFFAISYQDFRLTQDDIADAPEPGPESELEDRSTSVSGPIISGASGGGIFNPLWVFLLVLARYCRQTFWRVS